MKPSVAGVVLLLLTSCMPAPPGGDFTPPVVVAFEPRGDRVPTDVRVAVYFSEPVDASAAEEGLVIVAPSAEVDDAFLDDLDSPPLAKSRAEVPVPVAARMGPDGTGVFLQPEAPLRAGCAYTVAVSAAVCDLAGNPLVDELVSDEFGRLNGNATHALHGFATREEPPEELPRAELVFTEIMANPAGDEPSGEYCELFHRGGDPVDLAGYAVTDGGAPGDGDVLQPCPGPATGPLRPGGFALVAGGAFTPPAELRPGTPLYCTASSTLTARGLKNSGGETLLLFDPAGEEHTRYGGWLDFSGTEGCAAHRLDAASPDAPDNWAPPAEEPCRTPGWQPE